jgi:hypothetical protein
MMIFALGIELANLAPVQCPHDADPGQHRVTPRLHSISASIAVCHSGRSDSFFGSFVM